MSRMKESMFDQLERRFSDEFERARYPKSPGAKVDGTSREAALRTGMTVIGGRALVLESIGRSPKTADEVAADIKRSPLYVRPRMSELSQLGKIERTGVRRRNDSGLSADVWRVR